MSASPNSTPWAREIPIDEAALAECVAQALGDRSPLRPLGSGWDFDTWLCGAWVVRVPKRQDTAPALREEQALCAWLAPRLDWDMPEYVALVEMPGDPPVPVGLYRRVPGRPAIGVALHDADVPAIGARLGRVCRQLHALDLDSAPAPFPGARQRPRGMDDYVADAVARLPSLARIASPSLVRRVDAVLRGPRPPAFDGVLPLVHADMHGEHLLLTESAPARLSGVIDWGDARRADPALDFACPTFWGGEPLLRAALDAYGSTGHAGEDREALAGRTRFLALCLGFLDVDYYVCTGQRAYANAAVRGFAALTS